MSFDNEQGITCIEYSNRVRCFCPMGNDWYSADVKVLVEEPQTIPDYCHLDIFIRSLDGESLILEDVCARAWKYVKDDTSGYVSVSVSSSDAVHSPVTVTKAG